MEDSESDRNKEDDTVQETRGESEDEQSLEENERAEENPNSCYADSWVENLAKILKLRDQQPQHGMGDTVGSQPRALSGKDEGRVGIDWNDAGRGRPSTGVYGRPMPFKDPEPNTF